MRHDIRMLLNRLLPQAKAFVEAGEQRLAAQEARVAKLERDSRYAIESRKLLKIMRQTQALQIGHVRLLEREIEATGPDRPLPELRCQFARTGDGREVCSDG